MSDVVDSRGETKRFSERSVLITGGGSGIGAATSIAFAAEGAAVLILDVDKDGADSTQEEITRRGGRAVALQGDVSVPDDCARAVSEAERVFGGLDIAFCNAGIFEPGTCETQSVETWDRQIDVLLKGTFLTCKFAIPAIRRRGGGSVILSGSNCSHIGCSNRFAYTAAKSAMPLLAKQLSNDYFHTAKIRVNCVSPGYVLTGMTEQAWRRQTNSGPDVPLPAQATSGWQTPETIGSVVLFLSSDEAADITGVTIPVSRTALLRVAAQRFA